MNSSYLEKIRDKNILVTGGLGFVGHNLVKTLVSKYNCQVTIIDDCSNSSIIVLDEIKDKVQIYSHSILDTKKVFPILSKMNYIFHLACKQIAASGKDPLLDLAVNAQSTLQILEELKNNPPKNFERFIYTSSCSVYGSSTRIPVNEEDPTKVLSNYAATKLLGEHYTQIYNRSYQVPTSVVRYSNVYGFGQSPLNPYCGVLGKFVHNAITGQSLNIFGDGEQTRDYTFISDAVHATILAAVHPLAYGDIFNVGTNVETSVNRLAEIIQSISGSCQINHVPERDIDNIRRRMIDIEKIHQRLGWAPIIGMQKGIELTMQWYVEYINQIS